MSGQEPTGPDPFDGLPFLGDLARMLQQQGPVNWDAARQFAASVASGGAVEPNVEPLDRIHLEDLGRVADLHVREVTGLETAVGGRAPSIVPVNRGVWVQRSIDTYRPLFEAMATALRDADADAGASAPGDSTDAGPEAFLGGLLQLLTPMLLGMAAGSMLGHLARRSFGQYDLPVPRPPSHELLVVSATVDEFAEAWSLPPDDVRLWICVHELAHQAVLSVPHVRARLTSLLHDYAAGFTADPTALQQRLEGLEASDPTQGLASLQQAFGDPEVLLGAVQSPGQQALLPHLAALTAAIEGYVDHVLDRVGGRLIASYPRLTEAFRRRRVEEGPSQRLVDRLLGLTLDQAQYDRGEAFVAGVIERAGDDGLTRLWRSERELPTPAEVDAPGLWLARIDLPD
ncbi:MAG: zinc-dependent metalloprotease [Acidimicrobiales bacterium]|nr:zinc-dependent metalloprotease [Acidimicrobiales bacterium]